MRTTAAFVIFGLFGASPGRACSCVGPTPVCSVYWNTSLIFLGHVVRIEHVYDEPPEERVVDGKKISLIGPGQYLVHFDVTKSYRGAPGEQVVVHTNDQGSACGYEFAEGHDYLVYGSAATNGDVSTSHCSRTHEVTSRADDPDIQWIEALPNAPHGGSIFGRMRSLRPNELGGYDSDSLEGITVSVTGPESKTVSSDAGRQFSRGRPRAGQIRRFRGSAPTIRGFRKLDSDAPGSRLRGSGLEHAPGRTHSRTRVFFRRYSRWRHLSDDEDSRLPAPRTLDLASELHVTTAADGSFDFGQLSPGSYVFAANMDFSPQQTGSPITEGVLSRRRQ